MPDNVIGSLGYGSNGSGLHIGFGELLAAGEIDRLPKIFGAQAANCAALYAAWCAGGERTELEAQPTIADGIASERPVRITEVMAAAAETGGAIVAVEEDEIVASFQELAMRGFFVEPTCATAGAVLRRLREEGAVKEDETSVLVLTGHGLKAADKITSFIAP